MQTVDLEVIVGEDVIVAHEDSQTRLRVLAVMSAVCYYRRLIASKIVEKQVD